MNLKLQHYEQDEKDELVVNFSFIDKDTGNIYHGQAELYFCDEGCN